MIKKPFNLCAALVAVIALCGSAVGSNDSLYFFYQRSTYLENLNMAGGWWANPALTGEITDQTAYTVNVTPLGDRYTLASAKYLFPFLHNFGAGIGIIGTGISPPSSTQITQGGVSYNSHFVFSNPSLQIGLGGRIPYAGSAGLLVDIGAEMLPDGYGGTSDFLVTRGGIGYLTPYFFHCVSLSITVMSTLHFWQQLYMDNDGKAGLRFKILDDLVLGSAEYTFTFKSKIMESFYQSPSQINYEVFKTMLSVRLYKIAGILAGFSTDFGHYSDVGKTLHIGLELRPTDVYPFFGGYDMGISTSQRDLIIHRIWFGWRLLRHPSKG